jgi:hypothetical protein
MTHFVVYPWQNKILLMNMDSATIQYFE